ncbi:MAG: DUF2600 family protein [Solirubrobacterales bacterium]|nr:DUF2600 family protein [Solirubrobacterales bacterium]
MTTTRRHHAREILLLLTAGIAYWLTIYPRARREIRQWTRRARQIPDPVLRTHAIDKLSRERLNPEAAAFFAILAPRRQRAQLVRLMVAYQVAYDYLDAINEEPATAALNNGLHLHRALSDAVGVLPATGDYYRHSPHSDDGGYLLALVGACRSALRHMPSARAIAPVLIQAAERCGEAQSRNHAALVEGRPQLIRWTARLGVRNYHWWELAAGGISCLALHALFAAAAGNSTLADASRIDAAYFPSVCAISALLDSLIDLANDATTANHNFTAHYAASAEAATRFAAITAEARTLLATLRIARRHDLILTGIASFYLSAPQAKTEFARTITSHTLQCLGPMATPMLSVCRVMRRQLLG